MANTFTITIGAVDRASATVRRVNDSISRLTRPFEDAGKSFKNLARELGFERIGKNLGNIGREAGSAARGIGSIVAPMAAITGVGSVAGVAALASNWANLGRSIDNSAHSIGLSTGQLQSFSGAAKMMGIDTTETTSSLDKLATTMQDAQWGRNQPALMMFNKLGIGLKKSKDGAWDVVGQYKAVATAIAKEADPQKQKLIARAFGMEGMLPFLREGAVGIERYEAMVKRLGYVMGEDAVKRGKEFSQSLAGLGVVVDGAKNSIGDKLIPVMKPLIDQFTNWLAVNRELIATNVGDWAKGFATWIGKVDWKKVGEGIVNFGKGIGKVVDWLGGWENAALAVVVVMNAGLIGSVVSLGLTLGRAGIGILSFIGLLFRWRGAAAAAAAAQNSLVAGQGVSWLASGAAVGLSTAAAGIGSALYSSSLNEGEDEAVKRIRKSQGLPETEEQTPEQAARERSMVDSWRKNQGSDRGASQDQSAARRLFRQLELKNGLPPNLLDSVWSAESSRGANMLSSKGAKGHFGFMDPTAAQYGLKNPSNLFESADAAARMYRDLLKANGGNLDMALAGYNWGQGNVERKGLGAAPSETRDYISKVKAGMAAPTEAPSGPYTQGAAQGGGSGGKVQVDVNLKGAPEGTTATVESQGNTQASSRIAYTGVGGGV
ncbi:lytic transglycosylase domain-containing protein [Pseudomonas sp.]|uniref:lytic transglycosylase domain-containing protein n=1 Tax=Pseudomonas sp. TaxID=306 RepID=UPI003267DFAD